METTEVVGNFIGVMAIESRHAALGEQTDLTNLENNRKVWYMWAASFCPTTAASHISRTPTQTQFIYLQHACMKMELTSTSAHSQQIVASRPNSGLLKTNKSMSTVSNYIRQLATCRTVRPSLFEYSFFWLQRVKFSLPITLVSYFISQHSQETSESPLQKELTKPAYVVPMSNYKPAYWSSLSTI